MKRLFRSTFVQEALGFLFANYLRLVRRTSWYVRGSADIDTTFAADRLPVIFAMWHGQHLMIPIARSATMARASALVSRNADAGPQAIALRRLGVPSVRGSGGNDKNESRKGGAPALRAMLRQLNDGASVALTADVAKRARVAGLGIVTLARLSGRPIAPVAVASSRRLDFNSWDRASVGLPFGRLAVAVGDFIHVPRDADAATLEEARRQVEAQLDDAHARAYALIGGRDPGAGLRRP